MTWLTSAETTVDTNSTGWNGYTVRQRIAAAGLANGGSKVRVTLVASTAGSFTIDAAYIGAGASSGNAYDFETTPTQLLFSGAAGVTVAAGATRVSDEITYALNTSKPVVVSMHFSAASAIRTRAASIATWDGYYKAAASEAGTVDVTGYTVGSVGTYCVSKIESDVTAGRAKVWTGSAWALKPVKVWSGSAWVGKPLKVWNGSSWT